MAVLFTIPAIYLMRDFPIRYAIVLLLFALCLGAYVWLILYGPDFSAQKGRIIQVAGQKIIVYIAIISMYTTAQGALMLVPEKTA